MSGMVYQGYVDVRSRRHVEGWVHDLTQPGRRVLVEAVLDGRVIASDVADRRSEALGLLKVGDAAHAFYVTLPPGLSDAERDRVDVRPAGGGKLALAPELKTAWMPVRYVAMDVVDNCNLRCPFCLYDYSGVNRTNVMPDDVFESALRLVAYTTPQNFWMSCLHEPTLHPKLLEFVGRIAEAHRDKTFFTSNLAKRMPPAFWHDLARSNLHHINISIESLNPQIYERMRKGARHPIFKANWDLMLQAFAAAPAPPRIRYIILAYRSNVDELPGLVEHLLTHGMAWQAEIRFTYPQAHIPAEFMAAEILPDAAWPELQKALAHYPPERVILVMPVASVPVPAPGPAAVAVEATCEAPEAAPKLPGRPPIKQIEMYVTHDGSLVVNSPVEGGRDHDTNRAIDVVYRGNVTEIADMEQFITELL